MFAIWSQGNYAGLRAPSGRSSQPADGLRQIGRRETPSIHQNTLQGSLFPNRALCPATAAPAGKRGRAWPKFAAEFGYGEPNAFYRAFQKWVGQRPG